jgi:hypothetical protein
MPFVKMPGVIGKVYVPETPPGLSKKHPCPDCFACQQCSDDRCTVCRGQPDCAGGKDCRRHAAKRIHIGCRSQMP